MASGGSLTVTILYNTVTFNNCSQVLTASLQEPQMTAQIQFNNFTNNYNTSAATYAIYLGDTMLFVENLLSNPSFLGEVQYGGPVSRTLNAAQNWWGTAVDLKVHARVSLP